MSTDFSGLDSVSSLFTDTKDSNNSGEPAGKPLFVKLTDIIPDNSQPRKAFDKEKLNELADMIKESGVLSPISVSPPENGKYKIIFGERRYRASKIAGLDEIPVFIGERDVYAQMQENLGRDNLTADENSAFIASRLKAGESKAEIARKLGKSKTWVSTYAAILESTPEVKKLWDEGHITDARVVMDLNKAVKNGADVNELIGGMGSKVARAQSRKSTDGTGNKIAETLGKEKKEEKTESPSVIGTKSNKGTLNVDKLKENAAECESLIVRIKALMATMDKAASGKPLADKIRAKLKVL